MHFFDTKNFRINIQFFKTISSTFTISQSFYIYFSQENFASGPKMNETTIFQSNFYQKALQEEISYKTCGILGEMQEILINHQKLINSLNEIVFYQDKNPENLQDYKPAIDEIYNKICLENCNSCLESLYNFNNIKTTAKIIMKISPEFFINLSELKLKGPISDFAVSQNELQEVK